MIGATALGPEPWFLKETGVLKFTRRLLTRYIYKIGATGDDLRKTAPRGRPLGQQGMGLTELAQTAQKHRRTIGGREGMPVRQSSNMKADETERVLGALIEFDEPLKRADRQSVAITYS